MHNKDEIHGFMKTYNGSISMRQGASLGLS